MKTLTVIDEAGRDVLVRGPLRNLLRDNGIPAYRVAADRGWWLRRDRLADLVVYAERAGFRVHFGGGR